MRATDKASVSYGPYNTFPLRPLTIHPPSSAVQPASPTQCSDTSQAHQTDDSNISPLEPTNNTFGTSPLPFSGVQQSFAPTAICNYRSRRAHAMRKSHGPVSPSSHADGKYHCICARKFKRKSELTRHCRDMHVDKQTEKCPVRGCGRTLARKDKLRNHLRDRHKLDDEAVAQWVPRARSRVLGNSRAR